jgi:hypothetical protein
MGNATSDWEDELERWLKPFLDRLGHKARQRHRAVTFRSRERRGPALPFPPHVSGRCLSESALRARAARASASRRSGSRSPA